MSEDKGTIASNVTITAERDGNKFFDKVTEITADVIGVSGKVVRESAPVIGVMVGAGVGAGITAGLAASGVATAATLGAATPLTIGLGIALPIATVGAGAATTAAVAGIGSLLGDAAEQIDLSITSPEDLETARTNSDNRVNEALEQIGDSIPKETTDALLDASRKAGAQAGEEIGNYLNNQAEPAPSTGPSA